jgi:hypothetical protein
VVDRHGEGSGRGRGRGRNEILALFEASKERAEEEPGMPLWVGGQP